MHRGYLAVVVVGSALVVVASCDSFSEGEAAPEDGGVDASSGADVVVPDSDAIDGGAADGPSGACELLVGTTYATAEATVTALAVDGANVYWGSSVGTTRQTVENDAGTKEPVFRNLGECTDIVLGNFIAARFANKVLRVKSKIDISADASVPGLSGDCSGVEPRNATTFFAWRSDSAFTCTTATQCTQLLQHTGMTSIVSGTPVGYDFMATVGPAVGVFHCETNCNAADASTNQLATTSDSVSAKLASDGEFIYFLDRGARALRKVARSGGAASDVITGLPEPIDMEIDSAGRFVVATVAKGVFRGPKTGCVVPPTAAATKIGAMAVSGTDVWYADGIEIKRVAP